MTENNLNGLSGHPMMRQETRGGINKSETIHLKTNGLGEEYWKDRCEKLEVDYNRLQQLNQNLEERLLNVVETFEKKKEELIANVEYEKSTLMADVNKLSNKLVDAKIKLHDYQEKELIHAAECDAPCHKNRVIDKSALLDAKCLYESAQPKRTQTFLPNPNDDYDPNLV